jgi:hypothetical protein
MQSYASHPQRERDLFPQASVFASVGKCNQVPALAAPYPLRVSKVQVIQWKQLAHRASVVSQKEPLDRLKALVTYPVCNTLLFRFLAEQLIRRRAPHKRRLRIVCSGDSF